MYTPPSTVRVPSLKTKVPVERSKFWTVTLRGVDVERAVVPEFERIGDVGIAEALTLMVPVPAAAQRRAPSRANC